MELVSTASLAIGLDSPDQHFDIKKCRFGEQARRCMDKNKRDKERFEILCNMCALLNSGGGVISVGIENQDYDYQTMGLGEDFEKDLTELLKPSPLEDFIEFIQQGSTLHIYVKSWCPDSNRARLCSVDSGLRERSGTSTPYIHPNAVLIFLKKKHNAPCRGPAVKKQRLQTCNDQIIQKAEAFYRNEDASLGEHLDFGESVNVEFKNFDSERRLEVRLKENLPKYISAFANTKGGFVFIGIDDKTKKVVGCGQGLDITRLEQMSQDICRKAKTLAVHILQCAQKSDFSLSCKVFQVKNSSETEPRYIIAFKIHPFCCAVFEDHPKCWQVESGQPAGLSANIWLEEMHLVDPDHELVNRFENVLSLTDSPPQCKPVYSIQKIAQLQNRIFTVQGDNLNIIRKSIPNEVFEKYPNLLKPGLIKSSSGPGVLIMSTSWAVDINLPRNTSVICEALLITDGNYPTLLSWVENESRELWQYVNQTAFCLKQKLVNFGGYIGRLCVIPYLVDCQTGEMMPNEMTGAPLYPDSYTLKHTKEVEALLRALTIVVLNFTSPLSDTLGCELFSLLTEEQFNIFHSFDGIKHLFIHGLPGTGKTVIATEKIRRIKNSDGSKMQEILYLSENVGLREYMKKQDICLCETRVGFMTKLRSFSEIKHIIVDEGQNFRLDCGDWYETAKSLVEAKSGHFWIFADYFQISHQKETGLPPLSSQSTFCLHEIVRNSKSVFQVMSPLINIISTEHNSKPEMKTHFQKMKENMKLSHGFRGMTNFISLTGPLPVEKAVVKLIKSLLQEGHSARDIAVLFSTTEKLEESEVDIRSERLSVRFGSVEEFDRDVVVLDSVRRFSGLERNIVILVEPGVHRFLKKIEPNVFLSAFSRARIRLYVLMQGQDLKHIHKITDDRLLSLVAKGRN